MPLYDYLCPDCGPFDGYARMADSHLPTTCACGMMAHKVILRAPKVFGDFPGYESPIDGSWIEGKVARQNDLKRNGCRPYEDGEKEQMIQRQEENWRKVDKQVDEAVDRTVATMGI